MTIHAINDLTKHELLFSVEQGNGYCLAEMDNEQLECIRGWVKDQYLHTIQSHCSDYVEQYFQQEMSEYHNIYQEHHFPHANVWQKPARVLGPNTVKEFLKLPFCQRLRDLVGNFSVSDEEQFGWPGIYWRLVRPGQSDIGPLHADKWFWDLGHGDMPENTYRLKIWISLYSTPQKSGLRVVPESQLKDDWRYHGEERGGKMKPVFDEDLDTLNISDLPLAPGQFVIFHDKLLHGGMPNNSDKSRVSIEFTMLVPEN